MKHSHLSLMPVSCETKQRLGTYARLLLRWNKTINLVARSSETELDTRHFNDSLQLAPLLPSLASGGVDLGSGGGFPGLVLAIATGLPFILIESDVRKAAFLREVISATDASATVVTERIEKADVLPADVVTARALAPLVQLLQFSERLLKPTGVALFLKGKRACQEVAEARFEWQMRVKLHQSVTSPSGVVLQLTELVRAAG